MVHRGACPHSAVSASVGTRVAAPVVSFSGACPLSTVENGDLAEQIRFSKNSDGNRFCIIMKG